MDNDAVSSRLLPGGAAAIAEFPEQVEKIGISLDILAIAVAITLFAGIVKGAVGFAMPMIMISGLGMIMPPEAALAALILPTLVTSAWQALRGGWRSIGDVLRHYRIYLGVTLVMIAASAQLVRLLPPGWLMIGIGVPIVVFAIMQLMKWRLRLSAARRPLAEVLIGSIAGLIGGISGVWGPPTVAFLTAIEAPKAEQIRVQGVVYGLGAVVLAVAHVSTGILNSQSVQLSLAMLVPALLGMFIGFAIHDRLDQQRFRQLTLLVLVIAGLNLIRRGLIG